MRILISLLFFITVLFGADATIEVSKKVDILPGIGVEDASLNSDDTLGRKFFQAVVSDLNVLSLFNVDHRQYKVNYDDSSVAVENKDKDYVVRYNLHDDGNGLSVDMKLFKSAQLVATKNYKIGNQALYVFLSHAMAYDVNQYMGGLPVEWMKKKILISRYIDRGQSEILVADYTLTFSQRIVSGGINIFPKWANKEQTAFYYTSLRDKPVIKKVDIRSGRVSDILTSDGMAICSDVSADGSKILVTMAPYGQPDIYMYDVNRKTSQRLTTYGGIDVGGQFAANNKIVFVSNRLGYPNVFSKSIGSDESGVQQLAYYGKSNSACSANGDYVVFKARESSDVYGDNTFNLHLISTQTDFVRRLTANGNNEFPRFSDDGDAVLFIKNYMDESSVGIVRLKYNKSFLFPLNFGKIQSIDW